MKYFVDPNTGALYTIEGEGGIEGVELKEILRGEYGRLKAEREKQAEELQRQEAEKALTLAKEMVTQVEAARGELAGLGLSAATLDLLLPVVQLPQAAPAPRRRRAAA